MTQLYKFLSTLILSKSHCRVLIFLDEMIWAGLTEVGKMVLEEQEDLLGSQQLLLLLKWMSLMLLLLLLLLLMISPGDVDDKD